MKYGILLFLTLLLILAGCDYEGRGYAYEHLRGEPVERNETPQEATGVYDHLQQNLCRTRPACCDIFSEEEQHFINLQEQAKNNKELCEHITEELIVRCPEERIIYSQEYCLSQ